ncbi:hypothetical protein [Phycicoccus avicenniae]|uniref:hypothetical protein n=1 Tax=Phycicoccus avicenniae TaxID=2828860 RepID=UPI003D2E600E
MTRGQRAATGLLAAAVAAGAHRLLVARVRSPRWSRTNHAGDEVTLLEGPAAVLGATAGALAAGSPAGALAAGVSGALGALDDLAGDGSSKGLRGHLGAAARGEVTTGFVKVVGIGAAGLLAAALVDRDRGRAPSGTPVGTLVGGVVVAGSANLANLLDLRPGRALKATVLTGGLLALSRGEGGATAAAAVGAAAGLLPPDLAGRAMLGDTGANALGALVGTALVERTGLRGRLVAAAVLTALTLASEKVSFTAVIESTPGLRALDAWGRPAR